MDKAKIIKNPIKRTLSYSLLLGVVTLSLSSLTVAAAENGDSGAISADFDAGFLIGDAKKIDILCMK